MNRDTFMNQRTVAIVPAYNGLNVACRKSSVWTQFFAGNRIIAQNADALRDLHIQLKVLVEKEIMNFDVIQVLLSVDPVITSAYFWFNFPALSRRTEFLRTWNREKVIPFQKRSVVF